MPEDWRVTVTVTPHGLTDFLLPRLHEHEVEQEARRELGDRIAVSEGDVDEIYLYADTERSARAAERVVREIVDEHSIEADFTIDHWHPIEEEWQPASVPLPHTAAERAAEHAELERHEAAESDATGHALWEVRLDFPSHREAAAFEEQLEQEGFAITRRWKFVLVGAHNEDEARALAKRLRDEAPHDARVIVEPGGEMIWQVWPQNPFAVLGGLGS